MTNQVLQCSHSNGIKKHWLFFCFSALLPSVLWCVAGIVQILCWWSLRSDFLVVFGGLCFHIFWMPWFKLFVSNDEILLLIRFSLSTNLITSPFPHQCFWISYSIHHTHFFSGIQNRGLRFTYWATSMGIATFFFFFVTGWISNWWRLLSKTY